MITRLRFWWYGVEWHARLLWCALVGHRWPSWESMQDSGWHWRERFCTRCDQYEVR